MALLSCAGVDELRRGAAAALNWFSLLTLGLSALLIWLLWAALVLGYPETLVISLARYSPATMPPLTWGVAFALLVTALWGRMLFRKRPLGRRALTNWTSGLTLVIGLLVGLFQNWVDIGKSYRPVAESLAIVMKDNKEHCIDVSVISKDPTAAFAYFTDLQLDARPGNRCTFYMQQSATLNHEFDSTLLWTDHRLGDQKEIFSLHAR